LLSPREKFQYGTLSRTRRIFLLFPGENTKPHANQWEPSSKNLRQKKDNEAFIYNLNSLRTKQGRLAANHLPYPHRLPGLRLTLALLTVDFLLQSSHFLRRKGKLDCMSMLPCSILKFCIHL
jgi:hypothetical protein